MVVVVIDGAAAAEVVVGGADAGAKTAAETDAAKRGSKDDEEGAAWERRDRIVTRFLARTRAASAALPDKLGTGTVLLLLLRTTVCLLLFTGSQMVLMRSLCNRGKRLPVVV